MFASDRLIYTCMRAHTYMHAQTHTHAHKRTRTLKVISHILPVHLSHRCKTNKISLESRFISCDKPEEESTSLKQYCQTGWKYNTYFLSYTSISTLSVCIHRCSTSLTFSAFSETLGQNNVLFTVYRCASQTVACVHVHDVLT